MPKHAPADVNAVSAPVPPESVDETLKTKTPKKPKGWKKWKRRLSRVFKGKKKTKETKTSGKDHTKSAQHPERERDPTDGKLSFEEEPRYDDDDEDDGTDESPAASEKEINPTSRRHQDSREWRRSGRSEESSYVSERGEDWEEDDAVEREPEDNDEEYEDDDAVEHEPEDNGEEYEDDDNPHNEAQEAAGPHRVQHVEENLGAGADQDEEEVEYEDDEQQHTSVVQEPQTDEYDDDQELEHEVVVAEDEYEEEDEKELEVSAELQGSLVSECVDPASLNHSSGEPEQLQHSEDDEEEKDEEAEEKDDGGVHDDEEQLQGNESSVNSPTEVTQETVDAAIPSLETSGIAEDEEQDDVEHDEESDCGGDDVEERLVETVDLHLELSDDLHTTDHNQAADSDDGSTSAQEEDTDSDRSEVDTDEFSIGDAAVMDIMVRLPAPELSLEQQQELAAIVALIPTHLSLVRDVSAWCVVHTATPPVVSTECQLFLLSVESGKWKLAELLAEKLHRDHVRPTTSPQDDQIICAILTHCAA